MTLDLWEAECGDEYARGGDEYACATQEDANDGLCREELLTLVLNITLNSFHLPNAKA